MVNRRLVDSNVLLLVPLSGTVESVEDKNLSPFVDVAHRSILLVVVGEHTGSVAGTTALNVIFVVVD